jgi:hypothetical protein
MGAPSCDEGRHVVVVVVDETRGDRALGPAVLFACESCEKCWQLATTGLFDIVFARPLEIDQDKLRKLSEEDRNG